MKRRLVQTRSIGLLVTLAAMLAAGCDSSALSATTTVSASVAAITNTPAPSDTPLPPTSTGTARASTTATRQTATPTPTAQPPEPTTNLTAIVNMVLTANPTPQLADAYLSPNQRWRAQLREYDCYWFGELQGKLKVEQLILTDLSTGQSRLVEDQLELCDSGLGAHGLAGLYWSRDSRYFYYTDAREGLPDGGCLGWYRPATRLEVTTGERVDLVQGPASPAGNWMAGLAGQVLVVWNRQTGEVIRAAIEAAGQRAGAVAWAPDGRALVYLAWDTDCVPAAGQTSLVRFDLDSRQQSLLLTGRQVAGFASVIWDAPNRVRLFTMDNHEWRFNLVTGVLSQFS